MMDDKSWNRIYEELLQEEQSWFDEQMLQEEQIWLDQQEKIWFDEEDEEEEDGDG